MDFQEFGIDERILEAEPSLRSRALFHEKMLDHAVRNKENVLAKVSVATGRDEIVLLPAIQWLSEVPGRRALGLAADLETASRLAEVARRLGSGLGIETCVVSPGESGEEAATLEGSPSAALVIGLPESLLAAESAGLLHLSAFEYLLVDQAEIVAELPDELLRRLSSALKPAVERRSLVACGKVSTKAKNLAWDLADNPVELRIEEEEAKGQSVASETWLISTEEKIRFLLGVLARERAASVCIFCNLKGSAEEVSLRLVYNGVESDYILGSLAPERKVEIMKRLREESGGVLVLTDEGAADLPPGKFPLVVNFDIPLEPERYVKRLEMLDRTQPGAKVVNLACDRYVCGLPAVERYIGVKLESRKAGPEELRAEDKSAELDYVQPGEQGGPRRGRGSRAGRLVQRGPIQNSTASGGFAAGGARGDAPDADQRGGRQGSGRRRGQRPGYGHDEDISPAIRQSIAELTGAAPMRGSDSAARRGPEEGARENGQRSSDGRRAGGQRGPDRGSSERGGRNKPGRNGQHGGRRGQQRRGGRAPVSTNTDISGNPYDMPMEERMKLYREKYGQRLEAEERSEDRGGRNGGAQNGPRGGSQNRGGRPGDSQNRGPRQGSGAARGGNAGQRGPNRGGAKSGRGQPQSSGNATRAQPESGNSGKKPGFIDRLKGLFGKH